MYIYGHNKSVRQIKREYPYSNEKVNEGPSLQGKYTVTFDPHLAYALRKDGYDAVVWGGIYEGKRIFIIDKKGITKDELPFG